MTIEEYLSNLKIPFKVHLHHPVYTVEEAKELRSTIPGLHAKNLFLKDGKLGNFYLLTTEADKAVRLKEVKEKIGAKKLSFASEMELLDHLKLTPGAVSPFGLINDVEGRVIYILDRIVLDHQIVTFHPNDNSATLELSSHDFKVFLDSLVNQVIIIDL